MCIGKSVDQLPGATQQPLRNTSVGSYVPTLGESVDGHYFRTNSNAEKRHEQLGVHAPEMPTPNTPPELQESKTPDRDLTRNRKAFNDLNSGTLLTGPSGVSKNALTVGKTTLLGG